MDLSLGFLGTGGSVPSARRNTAAILVSRGGEQILFDCGEGTQRQFQRSTGLVHLDRIFLTHYHADHILGLPGLIKTYGLMERREPLQVFGPPGLEALFRDLKPLIGKPDFRIVLTEIDAGEAVRFDSREGPAYSIQVFDMKHRIKCVGYALHEETRPGRFDPETADKLGVSPGPDFGDLQDGRPVTAADGSTVRPEDVMGPDRPGRSVVICGDSAPSMSTLSASADADLLVHEASFTSEDAERAAETGHSTAAQAASLAAEAHVGLLALVHISSRYHVGAVLDEARSEFEHTIAPRDFDLIRVPYPDRGSPELVADGCRR